MAELYPFPDEFSPVGSSVFYSIRFAPPEQHSALSLANAFYLTLRNIPLTCSDPAVAGEKLNWWRQEIARSEKFQAQHPLAKAMSELHQQLAIPQHFFEPLCAATAQEIGSVTLQSDDDLESHCRATGALLADLYALIGGADAVQRESAQELGCYIRHVEIIRDLGADLRLNRCFLPANRLRRHGTSAAELLHCKDETQLNRVLSELFRELQQRYLKARSEIPKRSTLGPVLSLAAMAETLLRRLDSEGYQRLLRQRTNLTPLQKLWISWRLQRRQR
ncbi:MAG: squalene/phytoene synthase family protein [Gammaproteobacteria bacterium]|nr:squalene/phytoene synthase family protein [Gammaproteobacteria bacterium]MCP5416434.1 squalene/phytoene synthase family protein [Chromatiaceae bacterium]